MSSNLRKIKTLYSITSDDNNPQDNNNPLVFSVWLENSNIPISKAASYTADYNNYIIEWGKLRQDKKSIAEGESLYKSLLEQITLNYTTNEEKRFLQTIDFNNKADIDATIPFFAKRLKEITLYLSDKREIIKQQPTKISLAGTRRGITLLVRKIIVHALTDANFVNKNNIKSISKQEIDSIRVNIGELFDVNQGYHDIDPGGDDSDYINNITSTRAKLFNNESIEYDPYIFIDFEQAIENLLNNNVTGVLGENQLSSIVTDKLKNIQVKSAKKIEDLHESHFFNYIKTKENLNLYLIKNLVESSAGTDMYWVSGDGTGVEMKKLFSASNKSDNFYNINHPGRSTISEDILKSINSTTTVK